MKYERSTEMYMYDLLSELKGSLELLESWMHNLQHNKKNMDHVRNNVVNAAVLAREARKALFNTR